MSMANDARFSINFPLSAGNNSGDRRRNYENSDASLGIGWGLAGLNRPGLRLVFRGALRLNLGGVENAGTVELAIRERLRAIFEGIRQRIAACVRHMQLLVV